MVQRRKESSWAHRNIRIAMRMARKKPTGREAGRLGELMQDAWWELKREGR
jgi:hypothetical protein